MQNNHIVDEYVAQVLDGNIAATESIKKSCRRHINDLEKDHIYFDYDAADHAINFFSNFLKHYEGDFANEPFILYGWQAFIVGSLFGWKNTDDDLRRFRVGYIEVPRKNGKTTLLAGIGNYMFTADGEPGAQVYSAATKKDQAKILYNTAKTQIEQSKSLRKRVKIVQNNMSILKTYSKFEPLGADSDTMDGLNVHCGLVDELHAHKNSGVWDVLDTATGSRSQPLMLGITTAGYNTNCFCYEQHLYALEIVDPESDFNDDTFFTFIATPDEGDDWKDPETWEKVNPNFGVSVKEKDLKRLAKKASRIPSAQNSFLVKRLNIWTTQETRWIPMDEWDLVADIEVTFDELKGRKCYAGLDLASSTDIAAFVMVFPFDDGSFKIWPHFWIPEDTMREKIEMDRVPYDEWVKKGYITATEGNVINYKAIRLFIERMYEKVEIAEIAFDRWGAVQITQQLEAMNLTVVPFGQGFKDMSPPSKEVERLILQERLHHSGNPVLRWMAKNVVIQTDPADNIKPNKSKSKNRIDGIVAMIMAIDRATRHEDENNKSVYEKRGVRTL